MMHLPAWADCSDSRWNEDFLYPPVQPDDLCVRYLFDRDHRLGDEVVVARWSTLQRDGWIVVERVADFRGMLASIACANGWKFRRNR